jgi:DNA-binding transcriptional ArsR family regulator
MEMNHAPIDTTARAADAFAALGSESRLAIILTLVRAGPAGLPVGAVQERTGLAASTLSHHIKLLAAADLLTQDRQGRALICRASFESLGALADYLMRECCQDADAAPDQDAGAAPPPEADT